MVGDSAGMSTSIGMGVTVFLLDLTPCSQRYTSV